MAIARWMLFKGQGWGITMVALDPPLDAIRVLVANIPYTDLYTNGTLIAAEANVTSGWFDFQTLGIDNLRISHTRVGGTYVLEVDWSRDGITSDLTEDIPVVNNTSLAKTTAARYGRVRIKNTHVSEAFTAHRTVVIGRPR